MAFIEPAWNAPFAPPPARTIPIFWTLANGSWPGEATGVGAQGDPVANRIGFKLARTRIQLISADALYATKKPSAKSTITIAPWKKAPRLAISACAMCPGNSDCRRSATTAVAKFTTASSNRLKPDSTHQRDAAVKGTENPSGSRTNNHLNSDSMFEIRFMSSPLFAANRLQCFHFARRNDNCA